MSRHHSGGGISPAEDANQSPMVGMVLGEQSVQQTPEDIGGLEQAVDAWMDRENSQQQAAIDADRAQGCINHTGFMVDRTVREDDNQQ